MPIEKTMQELLVLTNAELTIYEPLSPLKATAIRRLDGDGRWSVTLAPEGIERTVEGDAARAIVEKLNERYRLPDERVARRA